jgi:hypothetical protein
MTEQQIEIAVFRKANGGLLSKRIYLEDGEIIADISKCKMWEGTAWRVKLDGVASLAGLINTLGSDEALTLGRLRAELPDECQVVTKRELNGSGPSDVIARSAEFLHFAKREPAYMLADHDTKGMAKEVAARLQQQGGFWAVVTAVCSALAAAARVTRRSTSAGLYDAKTNKGFAGSTNEHVYVAVADGSDIERALKTLHQRLWLAGFGYYLIGKAGQLLDRSIIDRSVYGAERLVFEGGPEVVPPLRQDPAMRRPQAHDGVVVDTKQAIPDLTAKELGRLKVLQAEAAHLLKPKAAAQRQVWAVDFAERRGLPLERAEEIIAAAAGNEHFLAAEFELEFDDDELGTCTVADVIDNPERFVGETLADPLEGPTYGWCKAKVLRRRDGTLMINGYAHGGIKYRLEGQGAPVDELDDVIRHGRYERFETKWHAVWFVIDEMLRRGYDDTAIVGVLLDRDNAISAQIYEQANPNAYAARQIARAKELIDFARDKDGAPYKSPDNIRLALVKLGVTLRHDQFADRNLLDGLPGFAAALDDAAADRLWLQLDKRFHLAPPRELLELVLRDTARLNSFHPVRNYLDGLQWDGKPRLDTWLIDCAGAEDSPYTRAVSALLPLAAVRRVRQPGCKFDEMMVLENAEQAPTSRRRCGCWRCARNGSAMTCRSMSTVRR